jgi:acyl transferase domain-containing protein
MAPGLHVDQLAQDEDFWQEQGLVQYPNPLTHHGFSGDTTEVSSSAQSDNGTSSGTPIAVCSMAVRLPGKVSTPAEFWDFLMRKGDGACKVPEDRFNIEAYYRKVQKSGTLATECGYYLDHLDLARFDASMFSMIRSEVEKLDPQHRLLLELTRECFEAAGEVNWRGSSTGCYIGTFAEDWLQMQGRDTLESTKNRVTGYGDYLLANRISYEYDLRGPRQVNLSRIFARTS